MQSENDNNDIKEQNNSRFAALPDEELERVTGGDMPAASGVITVKGNKLEQVCPKCGNDCWRPLNCNGGVYRWRCAVCTDMGMPNQAAGFAVSMLSYKDYPQISVKIRV